MDVNKLQSSLTTDNSCEWRESCCVFMWKKWSQFPCIYSKQRIHIYINTYILIGKAATIVKITFLVKLQNSISVAIENVRLNKNEEGNQKWATNSQSKGQLRKKVNTRHKDLNKDSWPICCSSNYKNTVCNMLNFLTI